jgi:astacin (peptidase family M12A)
MNQHKLRRGNGRDIHTTLAVVGAVVLASACGGEDMEPGPEIGQVAQAEDPAFCGGDFQSCYTQLWPNGIVKYKVVGTWSFEQRTSLGALMFQWSSATSNRITFVESNAVDAVSIANFGCALPNGNGYRPEGTALSVHPSGGNNDWCSLHDMGHLIGASHEHVRNNRDQYITVDTAKLDFPPTANGGDGDCYTVWRRCIGHDAAASAAGLQYESSADYGVYNSASIMHYGAVFDSNGVLQGALYNRDDGSLITLAPSVPAQDGSNLVELYAEHEWSWGRFESLGVWTSDTAKLDKYLAPGVSAAVGSSPAVSSQTPGALDVFVRGSDNIIYQRWCTGNCGAATHNTFRLTNWFPSNSWFPVPTNGVTDHMGSPASVSWGYGRVDLVSRRLSDSQVWHQWWQGGWGFWEPLGSPPGGTAGSPTIASRGANRLDIFARSTNGSIYWKRWNNGWSGWELVAAPPSGVVFASDPAAIATTSERVEVYSVATNGKVYYKTFVGWGWLGWETVGNSTTDPGYRPAVAYRGNQQVDMYLKGWDGRLWHHHRTSQNGPWAQNFPLGGEISGAPGAVAWPGGFHVFAIEGNVYPHAEPVRGVRYRHWPK